MTPVYAAFPGLPSLTGGHRAVILNAASRLNTAPGAVTDKAPHRRGHAKSLDHKSRLFLLSYPFQVSSRRLLRNNL